MRQRQTLQNPLTHLKKKQEKNAFKFSRFFLNIVCKISHSIYFIYCPIKFILKSSFGKFGLKKKNKTTTRQDNSRIRTQENIFFSNSQHSNIWIISEKFTSITLQIAQILKRKNTKNCNAIYKRSLNFSIYFNTIWNKSYFISSIATNTNE